MFRRIFVTALLAGLMAGLFAAGAQRVKLIPLIQQAELYEAAGDAKAAAHDPAADDHAGHDHASHDHGLLGAAEWQPGEGLERTAYTILANVLTGIGFALILTGAMACAGLAGHVVDMRRGFLWGAAGFAVFTLAPSLGLPPLPPGAEAADLAARQAWWAMTVAATALGIGIITFWPAHVARVAGVAVLVLPHLIGAPRPENPAGPVPGDLVAQFAVASIVTAALFWLVLGGTTGWLYRRLA